MIDLSKFQSGDVLLVRVRWNWKKLATYLSRAINFTINFWNGILTYFKKYDSLLKVRPYCPVNHVMIYVIDHEGNRLIFESNEKGFVRVGAYERLSQITIDNIWVKRYSIDSSKAYNACCKIEGTRYGWIIIFEDLIKELSNKKIKFVWKKWKGMVCSVSVANAINQLDSNMCVDWNSNDPAIMYLDPNSKFI
jgi:hypothetical protein